MIDDSGRVQASGVAKANGTVGRACDNRLPIGQPHQGENAVLIRDQRLREVAVLVTQIPNVNRLVVARSRNLLSVCTVCGSIKRTFPARS